ncbi:J domain-containing protein, partial [Stackebrandtia soli]|uniref:J domain-containing protein n=1 Tax=Stackebrandtia soli TaxID=1892856 RepID=UPI0039E72DBB
MTEPDYYTTLGVTPTADIAQIRQAYRRGVRDAHPDAGGDPERFHALQTAYETLSNATTRAEYDAARGIKRPRWRRPGKHAKPRRVKEWRVNTTVGDKPTTSTAAATTTLTGDLMARPWFIDINPHHRLRCTPSVWRRVATVTTIAALWMTTIAALSTTVLDDTTNLAWQAILLPYLILSTAVITTTSIRAIRPRKPIAEALTLITAAAIAWLGGLTPVPTLLAANLA